MHNGRIKRGFTRKAYYSKTHTRNLEHLYISIFIIFEGLCLLAYTYTCLNSHAIYTGRLSINVYPLVRLGYNGDVDTGDMINLCRSRRFMKILAFTVMSWLSRRRRRYKLRKVPAKIPRGRGWERGKGKEHNRLRRPPTGRDSLPFFFRAQSFVQFSRHHMLRDINGWEK